MNRRYLSWGLLALAWLGLVYGVGFLARTVAVALDLPDWWRDTTPIPALVLMYYAAKYILGWSGVWDPENDIFHRLWRRVV